MAYVVAFKFDDFTKYLCEQVRFGRVSLFELVPTVSVSTYPALRVMRIGVSVVV
jgi:hypothetical protein